LQFVFVFCGPEQNIHGEKLRTYPSSGDKYEELNQDEVKNDEVKM
jgi:hypothetical protein